jgi:hypothetical protein
MNLRLKNVFLPITILIALFWSCYPIDEDQTAEDLDLVASIYDKDYYSALPGEEVNKFQDLLTFVVVDTVMHIVDEAGTDDISRIYDDFVLQQIRYNMLKNGFTELSPGDTVPDVAITVSVMSSEHEVYYWYPYWGYYWGYGGYPYTYSEEPTNNYYYPWYGYGDTYTYKTGTILIEMVEVARIDPEVQAIPVIWAGILNGLLDDTQATTKTRLQNGIDQCFAQSAYLLK